MKKLVEKAKVLLRRIRYKLKIFLMFHIPKPLQKKFYKVKDFFYFVKDYHKLRLSLKHLVICYHSKHNGDILFALSHLRPIKIGTFEIFDGGEVSIPPMRGEVLFTLDSWDMLVLISTIRQGQYSFIRGMLFS